jgi:hypothetical protein
MAWSYRNILPHQIEPIDRSPSSPTGGHHFEANIRPSTQSASNNLKLSSLVESATPASRLPATSRHNSETGETLRQFRRGKLSMRLHDNKS